MVMIKDWRPLIIEMVATKQTLAEWDPQGLFPHHLPEIAASEESIAATERSLGVTLDDEYRCFLGFADGWKDFYQQR